MAGVRNDAHAMYPTPPPDFGEASTSAGSQTPYTVVHIDHATSSSEGGLLFGIWPYDCKQNFTTSGLELPVATLSLVTLLFGIVCCFCGFRLLKGTLFLVGLLFAGVLTFVICDQEQVLPHTIGNGAIALAVGMLLGLVTMLIEYVGLFMTGFISGLLLATPIVITASQLGFITTTSLWLPVASLFGCGLVAALASLIWPRFVAVLGSAIIGAALVCVSVDYILLRAVLLRWILKAVILEKPAIVEICWHGWVVAILWPILFSLGIIVQYNLTRKKQQSDRKRRGHHHNHSSHNETSPATHQHYFETHFDSHHNATMGHRRSQINPPNPNKRPAVTTKLSKHLRHHNSEPGSTVAGTGGQSQALKSFRERYQARQRHGEVICQSFMESLERMRQHSLDHHPAITPTSFYHEQAPGQTDLQNGMFTDTASTTILPTSISGSQCNDVISGMAGSGNLQQAAVNVDVALGQDQVILSGQGTSSSGTASSDRSDTRILPANGRNSALDYHYHLNSSDSETPPPLPPRRLADRNSGAFS